MINNNLEIMEVFRNLRHDWLNKIQLIKGNIALGKMDQVEQIIDNIVWTMQHEARLMNLNLPHLATLFITHHWFDHLFQLEYEVLDDNEGKIHIQTDDSKITRWTIEFFKQINFTADFIHDHILYATLECTGKSLMIYFHFTGKLQENTLQLKKWLENQQDVFVEIEEFNLKEFMINVTFT